MRRNFSNYIKTAAVFVIIAVLFLSSVINVAGGSELDSLRQKQRELNNKIIQQQKKINDARKREKTATNELEVIERELELTELELEQVTAQLIAAETKVRKIQKELEEAEKKVKEQEETFKIRAVSMYKNGPIDYLEVILDSKTFSDFVTRMDIISKIIEYDSSLLNSQQNIKSLSPIKKLNWNYKGMKY